MMTEYSAPGRRDSAERERIRGCAGRDEKRFGLAFEDIVQQAPRPGGERVVPIGRHGAIIGGDQRIENARAGADGIVAGKVDHAAPATACVTIIRTLFRNWIRENATFAVKRPAAHESGDSCTDCGTLRDRARKLMRGA